jgi:hypothetical protein
MWATPGRFRPPGRTSAAARRQGDAWMTEAMSLEAAQAAVHTTVSGGVAIGWMARPAR